MSSNEEDHTDLSSAKKRKIQRACDTCRRKKIRCTGPEPPDNKCSSCVEYNIECTYEDAPKKRGRPKGYVEGLENRVQKLEKLLKKICPDESVLNDLFSSINPDDTAHLTKMPASTSVSSPSISSPLSPPPSSDEAATSAVLDMIHRIAAITLGPQDDPFRDDDFEHVVLSERMKLLSIEPDDARFFGKSSGAMFMQTAILFKNEYAKDAPIKRRVLEGRRPMFWTRRPWENELLHSPAPTYTFPPPDLIAELTSAYFEHVNLFFPLLHKPTFERAVANDLHLKNGGFGGVLLLVCAVGSRYLEKIDERTLMDGVDSPHSAGWRWYSQVQVVKQRLLEPPTLYDLQSYCLAVEFLQGCFAPHACWVLVGIGIRLAQDVGAHRRRVPREKLTVEDELWKRAFWVLVTMDRMASMGMGRPCAILDDDFDLDMPIECDDEYWEHPDPNQRFRQPPGVPSTVTAFNRHLRLNKIMAFALYTIYSIKTKFWEFILQQWEQHIVAELDSALNNWLSLLPEYLRWDSNRIDDRFYRLSGSLITGYYHVQILIHRPYIRAKGQPSPLAFPSLAICTSAARSCSLVLEQQMKRTVVVYPYMQLSAVTAGIVLLLHMWGSKRSGVAADPKAMRQIELCMSTLRKAEERWHSAGLLLDILNELASVGEFILPEEDSVLGSQDQQRTVSQTHTDTQLRPEGNINRKKDEVPQSSSGSDVVSSGLSLHDAFRLQHPYQTPQFTQEASGSQGGSSSHSQQSFGPTNISSNDASYTSLSTMFTGRSSSSDPISSLFDSDEQDMGYSQPRTVQQMFDESTMRQPIFGSGSIPCDPCNQMSTRYPSSGGMPDDMGLPSFQNIGYSDLNMSAPFNQQQAVVDSNTMAMWLNAPTGFEFNEWGTFLTNVTELTNEPNSTQQTDPEHGPGPFRMY